jgi:hypothetical protein
LRSLKLVLVTLVVAAFTAACSSGEALTVEPTQALIPATDTAIPTPVPPTATPAGLPRPADLVTPQSTLETATTETPEVTPGLDDPVADDLVALAQRRIAQELNLPVRRIRLVEVKFYTWENTSLGCPLPGETYAAGTVDGYRIVLEAGDQQYIFHTDFDRALPCDAKNEKLPPDKGS